MRTHNSRPGFITALFALATLALFPSVHAEKPQRTHSYIQASLGIVRYDSSVKTYPGGERNQQDNGAAETVEPIKYTRSLGVDLRASWQAGNGIFAFLDYFGSEGCVNDCYRSEDAENTSTAFERYYYGLGWTLPVNDEIEIFATLSRERHIFEICDDYTSREEHCRINRRRGYTAGAGAVLQFDPTWSLTSHYERYRGIAEDEPLQRLGNGRLSTTLEIGKEHDEHSSVYLEHIFERNESFRIGMRFYY